MSDKYILDGQTFIDGWEDLLKDIKLADTNITVLVDDSMPRTKEAAIDYLYEIGWLPEHDKILSPKEGSWVKSDKYNGYFVCSVCGDCYVDSDWISSEKWKYCPSCGAHMSYDEQEKRNV
jgi:hypothetical protein